MYYFTVDDTFAFYSFPKYAVCTQCGGIFLREYAFLVSLNACMYVYQLQEEYMCMYVCMTV